MFLVHVELYCGNLAGGHPKMVFSYREIKGDTNKNILHWIVHEMYLFYALVTGYVQVDSVPDSGQLKCLKAKGNCASFSYFSQIRKL